MNQFPSIPDYRSFVISNVVDNSDSHLNLDNDEICFKNF